MEMGLLVAFAEPMPHMVIGKCGNCRQAIYLTAKVALTTEALCEVCTTIVFNRSREGR